MTVVLFEPHHDDAVLFACYTLIRLKPQWITVLGDARVQEPTVQGWKRSLEGRKAAEALECYDWIEWNFSDVRPPWRDVWTAMREYESLNASTEVWAPLQEEGGHEQHDAVGKIALDVFGDRCRFYATYRRGSGRTRTDNEVKPEPDWYAKKFKAMACYTSQINLDNCRPWFSSDDMLREWIA